MAKGDKMAGVEQMIGRGQIRKGELSARELQEQKTKQTQQRFIDAVTELLQNGRMEKQAVVKSKLPLLGGMNRLEVINEAVEEGIFRQTREGPKVFLEIKK